MNLLTSSTYRPDTDRLSDGADGSWCVLSGGFTGKRLFRGSYSELGQAEEISNNLERGKLPVAGTHPNWQAGGTAK